MITRFESTPEHLIVESRRNANLKLLVAASLVAMFMMFGLILEYAGLMWLETRAFTLPPTPVIVALLLVVGVGLPLAATPWLFYGRERIVVRDRELIHERFVGPRRTFHACYELLRMRGLRLFGTPGGDVTAAGLWFWYGRTAACIGDTLSPDERDRVRDELLAYDARARVALGIDPALGLADAGVWESPEVRRAMFEEQVFRRRHVTFQDRDPDDW